MLKVTDIQKRYTELLAKPNLAKKVEDNLFQVKYHLNIVATYNGTSIAEDALIRANSILCDIENSEVEKKQVVKKVVNKKIKADDKFLKKSYGGYF